MCREEPQYNEYGLTQCYWIVRHRENFKLGRNTEIGAFTIIDAEKGVEIQDNVKIGFSCVILSVSTIDGKQGLVTLKKNCRIGANSTIMPGVTVGENSIVGANSFVSKDVPMNEIWFGSPAKHYKNLEDNLEACNE